MLRTLTLLLQLTAPNEGLLAHDIDTYLAAAAPEETAELDRVVVTATRTRQTEFIVPATVDSVPAERIRRRAYRTLPQVLRDLPGVLVQETAAGQGSPYIRGFTGFRNVFLIDGIRLNNSVFRSGPNQYWNTVDPLSLGRVEVVRGPTSVLWGSDAIGGTLQAFSKSAFDVGGDRRWAGSVFYRVSTAENSHIGRAEVRALIDESTAVLAGLSAKHFGDVIAGDPVDRQPGTGYDEWDGDVKIERYLNDRTRLVVGYQHVQQNNVPRTHKTVDAVSFHGTSVGSELKRELDQERWLVYAQVHAEDLGGTIDAWRASLSWHSQSEVRDRLRTGDRRDKQGFDVGTLGFWVQLESPTTIGRLTYGLELYHDEVDSFSTGNPIQGPVADDATYDLLGVFVQDVIDLGERWELILGVRFTYAAADADRVRDPETGDAISIDEDWTAFVGSARALYRLVPERWNLFAGVSQGFRAPNLSDLTRFDSARSNEFEVPSPGLDPECTLTFELGAKGRLAAASVEISVFYTDIRDQIVRFPTGDTNTDGEFEITKDNVGEGWIWGIELAGSWAAHAQWTVFGNLTYMEGKVDTFPTSASDIEREWISRLMPLTAQVGVRWDHPEKRFWGELAVRMAAAADRLSTRDEGDTQRIPPGGTPGYGVVDLRGGWSFRERARLVVAVENLFDKAYRVHGSGTTMPGVNLVASVSVDF